MGYYYHITISAKVTDKQKRLLKRIFNLPKHETVEYYYPEEMFDSFEFWSKELEDNNILYFKQDEGTDLDTREIEELSEILGDTYLEVMSYAISSGDIDEKPEYSTWINGKEYSEEEMYEKSISSLFTHTNPTVINIVKHTKIRNDMWSKEEIFEFASYIDNRYTLL